MSYFPRLPSGAVAVEHVRRNLAVELPALVNLWSASQANMPQAQFDALVRENGLRINGNAAAIAQKCAMAAGVVGVMPSNWGILSQISQYNTIDIALGIIWETLQDSELIGELRDLLVDAAKKAIGELLGGIEQLASGIPILGWVVDIVVGFVKIVRGLKNLSENANVSAPPDLCVAPVPEVEGDAALRDELIGRMQTWDWNYLFLPPSLSLTTQYGGPVTDRRQVRGFNCCPLEVQKTSNKKNADFQITRSLFWAMGEASGAGIVPGTGTVEDGPWIHNQFIFENGYVTDTGDWSPQTRSVGSQAWGYLWSGPTAFCADGEKIRSAWTDYIGTLLSAIGPCTKIGAIDTEPLQRQQKILDRFGMPAKRLAQLGIDLNEMFDSAQTKKQADAIGKMAPILATTQLKERQIALCKRPVVAYVDSYAIPPGPLRDKVRDGQKDILQSLQAVCMLDVDSIPDLELRSVVEFRQDKNPVICANAKAVKGYVTSPIGESESWDPSASSLPAIPDIPESAPSGSSPTGKPARAKSPAKTKKKQSTIDGSTLVTIGTLGVILGGSYLYHRKK